MSILHLRSFLIATCCLLAACGGDDSSDTSNDADGIEKYSLENLRVLAAEDITQAINIIRARSRGRLSTVDEMIFLAELYNQELNGSAALGALEIAQDMGATSGLITMQMAEALMLERQFEEASDELRLVSLSGPNRLRAIIMQAEIAGALGDANGARRFYKLAANSAPQNARIQSGLAILELNERNFEAAIEQADTAIAKAPDSTDPKPYYVKGASARLQGESEQAIEFFKKALERNPDDLFSTLEMVGAYLDLQNLDAADHVLDKLIAQNSQNNLARFYTAYIAAERGDIQAAENILLQTADLINTYPPAKRLYGHLAYDLEKYETASAYLEDYLETVPGDGETRLKLAESKTNTGKVDEAVDILTPILPNEQALEALAGTQDRSPNALGPVIESIARTADAEMKRRNFDVARRRFSEAVVLAKMIEPADPDLVQSLSAILATAEFAAGKQSDGIATMKNVTANDTATARQLTTLANMQMSSGDLEAALKTASRMKAAPETEMLGHNIEGVIAHRRKDYATAIAAYSAALAKKPDYSSALMNRAASYIEAGQFEPARADLLSISDQAGSDGQYYGMLGRVQLELQNYVAAIEAYEIARGIIPQSGIFAANHASALMAKDRIEEAIVVTKEALELLPKKSTTRKQVQAMLKTLRKAQERAETFRS